MNGFAVQRTMAGLVLALTLATAAGQRTPAVVSAEDYLSAPDRIEWQAGGLYDGRFEDGTHFQIELAYPPPASLDKNDLSMPFYASYWYPKHVTDRRFPLTDETPAGGVLRLAVRPNRQAAPEERFEIVLAPDATVGRGTWTSSRSNEHKSFTLRRTVTYDYVIVKRPAPKDALQGDPERKFVFRSWFPIIGNTTVDAWIREQANRCAGDLACSNQVNLRWISRALLSLEASSWHYDYKTPHGNIDSTSQQFGIDHDGIRPLTYADFVHDNPACTKRVTMAIVGQLRALHMAGADDWSEYALQAVGQAPSADFTPTANGIAFHFDPYQVGPYLAGAPSVFVTRAQIGNCLRRLPIDD